MIQVKKVRQLGLCNLSQHKFPALHICILYILNIYFCRMKAKQEGIEGLSQDNSAFWDELCGSSFAHELGIVGVNKENLKKFSLPQALFGRDSK